MASLGRLFALAVLVALLVPAFELDRRTPLALEAPAPAPSPGPGPAPVAGLLPGRAPRGARARPRTAFAVVPAKVPAAPSQTAAAPPLVSLDELLYLPKPAARASEDLELDTAHPEGAPAAETPRRRRVHVDFSRESVQAPVLPERRQTDVGVAVGVDAADRVRVRGGLRVDEREKSEAERESKATPTLGVEVRF